MTLQPPNHRERVLLLGATGSIGQATARALVAAGADVTCLVRPRSGVDGRLDITAAEALLPGATIRACDVADETSLSTDGFAGEAFDTVISCLASRTGAPADAWAIDHGANLLALKLAKAHSVKQFTLLSAICVQRPKLAFQHAKLAFEAALIKSGLTWSIVRPTAYFKSLSGQVARVQAGKPFLLFGDGALTACKPISDDDLGRFLAECSGNPARRNRVLPIGGPGPALTPRQQGELIFRLTGQPPKFRHVPIQMMNAIIGGLSLIGTFSPAARAKAELAKIGRYYATESMLVWDEATGRYDADATPETGADKLKAHYTAMLAGEIVVERGDHAVF